MTLELSGMKTRTALIMIYKVFYMMGGEGIERKKLL